MGLQKIVVLGAGGMGREVLDIFDALNATKHTFDVLGYIVDPQYGAPGTFINDRPILGDLTWLSDHKDDLQAICGIGAPQLRLQLVKRAQETGVRFCSVVHPSAILTRWVRIGEGTVVTAGCILTNQIRIGNHVLINVGATIAHDVVMEDYVTLAPGVHVAGNVRLREGCHIGTGANIIEKNEIGAWSIVGAGSTIVAPVPKNTTVVGVPGRVIKTRPDGWHLE